MERIRIFFEELVPMNDSDWSIFSSFLQPAQYAKRCPILKLGQVEKHLSFIAQGSVRLFIPGLDNDQTFGFCFENQFVSAYDSFLTQTPCHYQVEAMTDTTLWRITHADLQTVYQETSIGSTIGRLIAEQLYLMKTERERSFLTETAEDRYLALFEKRPQLLREIPLKHIASYIGVTPQALSRIRKRIS